MWPVSILMLTFPTPYAIRDGTKISCIPGKCTAEQRLIFPYLDWSLRTSQGGSMYAEFMCTAQTIILWHQVFTKIGWEWDANYISSNIYNWDMQNSRVKLPTVTQLTPFTKGEGKINKPFTWKKCSSLALDQVGISDKYNNSETSNKKACCYCYSLQGCQGTLTTSVLKPSKNLSKHALPLW